ncbi:uncharacterized protein LOC124194776 [Daphnia pulex]|uniref:uncharacterized protein LOC124194776 n=1 Tax=Daphnia pulex TaxID=6669 RepID=UPI001EE0227B|nr:uncharacterized protein LOC124194776 [Daphnia pulex]
MVNIKKQQRKNTLPRRLLIKQQRQYLLTIRRPSSTTLPRLLSLNCNLRCSILGNMVYLVVLLLGVISLMAGSTTGVPMSPGYSEYQTATPLIHSEVNIRNICYYTEAPKYTTELSAPAYFTDPFKYDSAPSYYQTEAPVYYTKVTEYYTTTILTILLLFVLVSLMVGSTTGVPMSRRFGRYQTTTPASYHTTTTKAAESYTTKAAESYTTKAAESYTNKSNPNSNKSYW